MKEYFLMGLSLSDICEGTSDVGYPKHLIRDNANLLILFK